MPRLSLSVLLLLSVGVFQTFAASPRIQLEIGTDASGCVNVGGCSYGCGKISSAIGEKNILTPLCPTGEVKSDYPQHLTIRGKPEAPHIFDEDRSSKYKCSAVENGSNRFVCRHKNKKNVKSANPSASASADAPRKVHSSVVNDNFYRSSVAPQFRSSASAANFSIAKTSANAIHTTSSFLKSKASTTPVSSAVSFAVTTTSTTPATLTTSSSVAKSSSAVTFSAVDVASSSTSTSQVSKSALSSITSASFSEREIFSIAPDVYAARPSISVTKSAEAAVVTPDSDVCQYVPEILGTGKGLGNLDDCCLQDDDCHGSCIDGACDSENNIPTETWESHVPLPTPTACKKNSVVYNKGRGLGNLGDCCINSNDCRGACISGACNAENNVSAPVCSNNAFKGRRKGNGPEGVCCNTEADCVESCDRGVCTGAGDEDEDFQLK